MNDENDIEALKEVVSHLKQQVDGLLEAMAGDFSPFKDVFLAKKDGDDPKGWKEVTIGESADVVDHGQPRTAAPDDVGKMLDLATITGGTDTYAAIAITAPLDGKVVTRYVKIGGGSVLFPVDVGEDGGDAGTRTTACTFTYSVRDLDGTVLGTEITPAMQRPLAGRRRGALHGTAYYDRSGNLILHWCDEVDGIGPCAT